MDNFTRAYIQCALWTGVEPPEGHELAGRDNLYDLNPSTITPLTLARMEKDCAAFQDQMRDMIEAAAGTGKVKFGPDCPDEFARAGHDFWLTRNGHGAGFWDGDWPEPMASVLDKAAESFGGYSLFAEYDAAGDMVVHGSS